MIRKALVILLVLAMAFSLAACNKGGSGGDTPAGEPGNAPGNAPAGKVEIFVAFGQMANGLDPVSEDVNTTISICNHFYDRLLELDLNNNRIPAVARSMKQVSDVAYEFDINLDYKFSNGEMLTMEDVKYSIERLASIPKSADSGNAVASVTYEGNILTITMKQHDNSVIHNILGFSHIVNKKYMEENGDEALYIKPIGTGPYAVTEFIPGTSVRLEVWDGYPFEKPQIDIINIGFIPDATSRYAAVETGQIQYAGLVTAMEKPLAEKDPNLTIFEFPSNMTIPLAFNCESEPFDNYEIRRAVVHAIDFNGLLALNGGRLGTGSAIFAGFDNVYVDSPGFPEYNLDKAREILSSYGYTPENPLRMRTIFFRPDPGIEFIQSSLRTVGVDLVPDQLEFSVFLQYEATGNFDANWTSNPNRGGHWLPDLDRLDYDNHRGQRNLCFWRDRPERAQEIISILRTTTDEATIKALSYEINEIIGERVPIIALFLMPIISIADSDLTGVEILQNLQQNFRNAEYNP